EEDGVVGGFAGLFGDIARQYFERYGDCGAELGIIAAQNHANGVDNPYAHMRKDLGVEFCSTVSERNPLVAPPLRRTDCSMISDGAAALVVVSADVGAVAPRALAFRSRSQVNDYLPLSRRDPTAFAGARLAWQRALSSSNL